MPKWTPEEDQIIRDKYQELTDVELSRHLGRGKFAVTQRRQVLGLVKTPGPKGTTVPSESVEPEQVSQWERQIVRLQDELSDLKRRHKEQTRSAAAVETVIDALGAMVPDFAWTKKPQKTAIVHPESEDSEEAVLLLSDLHFGAVVDPEEVPTNAYNLEIAKTRLAGIFARARELATEKLHASKIHVCLMGDLVSGLIHDELEVTNDLTAPEQVVEAADALQVGIQELADAIGPVSVVSVSGNHGRLRQKKRISQRQIESFDWLCAQVIKRGLAERGEIEFAIPRSPWVIHHVAGLDILIHHGDTIRSWSGLPAYGISRDAFRRKTLLIDHDIDFDLIVMGHLHQHGILPITANLRVIMNGSLIGMDPYADSLALGGTPSQTLFGVHPDIGVTSVWELKSE